MLAELEDLPSQFMGLVRDGRCSLEDDFVEDVGADFEILLEVAAALADDFAIAIGTIGSCGMGPEMRGGVREPMERELR